MSGGDIDQGGRCPSIWYMHHVDSELALKQFSLKVLRRSYAGRRIGESARHLFCHTHQIRNWSESTKRN
jgi:hypothetical protein